MLKGTAASEGIGIGKVMVIKEHTLEYTPKQIDDVQAEIQRYKKAVDTFCDNTRAKADSVRLSAGEKESEILLGHIQMIRDPFMEGEIEKLIQNGTCAESALQNMCDTFIAVFSAADDELTKQRATDLRDVRTGVLSALLGVEEVKICDAPKGTVIVAGELTPSMTAGINKENIVGIVTETGGITSHSAILARALEIPAVLSVEQALTKLEDGMEIIVDGSGGEVIADPDKTQVVEYSKKRETFLEERRELEKYRGQSTKSADGIKYQLYCNIGRPDDAVKAVECDGEGVGLFRTEFLFMGRTSAPTEQEQFEAYKKAALILKGRPMIIRTLDIGGDKELPYLGLEREENPFMGFRAIRYCLKNRELFKTQIRSILRASAYGEVMIMFPLITCVEELRQGKELVEIAKNELKSENVPFDENIKVGVMTETSSAGVIADILAKEADFFSIGTNDLTGYTMACDRGNSDVSYLYSPFQPSVLRLIKNIIECGVKNNLPVGMCGEAAGNKLMIPLLISFGLTEFSVSAPSVLSVRKTVSEWTKEDADRIAERVMSLSTEEEIVNYLKSVVK